jgi:hypothetical protein
MESQEDFIEKYAPRTSAFAGESLGADAVSFRLKNGETYVIRKKDLAGLSTVFETQVLTVFWTPTPGVLKEIKIDLSEATRDSFDRSYFSMERILRYSHPDLENHSGAPLSTNSYPDELLHDDDE